MLAVSRTRLRDELFELETFGFVDSKAVLTVALHRRSACIPSTSLNNTSGVAQQWTTRCTSPLPLTYHSNRYNLTFVDISIIVTANGSLACTIK